MSCKGICDRHKAIKPARRLGRYVTGQKRCQICGIFMTWPGLSCPCCGHRLRTRPRNFKYKSKWSESNKSNHLKLTTVQNQRN